MAIVCVSGCVGGIVYDYSTRVRLWQYVCVVCAIA